MLLVGVLGGMLLDKRWEEMGVPVAAAVVVAVVALVAFAEVAVLFLLMSCVVCCVLFCWVLFLEIKVLKCRDNHWRREVSNERNCHKHVLHQQPKNEADRPFAAKRLGIAFIFAQRSAFTGRCEQSLSNADETRTTLFCKQFHHTRIIPSIENQVKSW